ncbi:MAG: tyrosine-type recombinase/integrase [Clostridia bacterium]
MKKSNDYFKQRNIDNMIKLRIIRENLPSFCCEFFIGIENNTSVLTRLNYAYDLRIFFFYLTTRVSIFKQIAVENFTINDLKKVTTTHLELFIDFLSYYTFNNRSYTNENKGKARKLSTVRAMFKYFYNKDYLSSNPSAKINMPKINDIEIVRLETDEVVNLLNIAEFGGSGLTKRQEAYHERTYLRDTALLTLFLGTGLRISECVGLNINDIDFSTNGFIITRKGGNKVILYFSNEVAQSLKDYLDARKNDGSPKNEPALFLSLQNKRISTRAVQNLVKKYSQIIAPLKNISPHKLRSTYGTTLYRETGDIYVVAEVLGHRDVNTTKKHYAAMSDDIRRDAARKVTLRDKNE